jgi:excisionase family DNA binding protein
MSIMSTGDGDQPSPPRRPVGYTVDEVAAMLRVSRNMAYRMVSSGDVPSIKVGRLLRIPATPFHQKFGDHVPA